MVGEKGDLHLRPNYDKPRSPVISKVELLGIGSVRYQKLKKNLETALTRLSLSPQVVEVTDIDQLMSYDVSGIPALIVDGILLFQKVVPSADDIVDVLRALMEADVHSRERFIQQAVLAEVNRKESRMKKILVPTDFSKCSMNALGYAVDIANQFGCKITLFHSYKMYSTAGMFVSVEKYMEKDAAEDLLDIIEKVEPKLRNGASIESKLLQGDPVPLIVGLADRSRYDLIIMGTKGATGLKEVFTGSIANGVIQSSETPVLAVPDNFDYQPIDKIVLAVDEEGVSNSRVTEVLVKLVKGYDASLHIFHKSSVMNQEGTPPSVNIQLEDITPSYHYELDKENVLGKHY
jgi:nucleotide-binding universal stress UspA family protein